VSNPFVSKSFNFLGRLRTAALGLCVALVAACGGGADAPPPFEGAPGAVAPVITQQPASLSATAGQPASFTVAATGTAPLAYQWQRNGSDIAGATATTYTLAATVVGDSGAVFRAVVSNAAGTATSHDATLTVTTAAPVLTITQQPTDASVTAGSAATFTVAATCSAGTLNIQWRRNSGAGGAFVAIDGATSGSVSVSPSIADSGAKFQAALDCSGQSATTSVAATLTVSAPGGITLDLLALAGLREQALLGAAAIDQNADGSFTLATVNRLQRLSADLLSITPLAGDVAQGAVDGPAASATFNQPQGLTHDASGNIYVADTGNHVIRRIAPDGTVSTLAGQAGASGTTDGTGGAARFNGPRGIALGPDGDLYVADTQSGLIRRVTTAGVVTTYAGSTVGYADNASALAAQFFVPRSLAVAANGDVLVADTGNSRVRRIVRSGNAAGAVQTLAGSGSTNVDASPHDGTGTAAVIVAPLSMVVQGNTLTLRDNAGYVRQIDLTTAAVTTLTGSRLHVGTVVDGPAAASTLSTDGGITTAPAGGFMLANGSSVSSVSASGVVQTIANNNSGSATQQGTGVLKQLPLTAPTSGGSALTVDPAGNVVIATEAPKLVRRISPTGVVSLLGGLDTSFSQMVDGTGSQAQFGRLGNGLSHDSSGVLYVSDFGTVRKIDALGAVTLLAGKRYPSTDGFGTTGAVDGDATTARLGPLLGLVTAADGRLYVVDSEAFAIRRIDANGSVTTVAGALGQQGTTNGPSASARFRQPQGVAAAPDGSLLVLDAGTIRRISADLATVSTVDTSSVNAQISFNAIAIDADGTVYFGAANGLWVLRAGQSVATRLIAGGNSDAVVLGSAPHLSEIISIAVLAPKQLVLVSGGQVLKATLP
jgi:sugar lactone lactonase YvrE